MMTLVSFPHIVFSILSINKNIRVVCEALDLAAISARNVPNILDISFR
jgi:hypothetical protein